MYKQLGRGGAARCGSDATGYSGFLFLSLFFFVICARNCTNLSLLAPNVVFPTAYALVVFHLVLSSSLLFVCLFVPLSGVAAANGVS